MKQASSSGLDHPLHGDGGIAGQPPMDLRGVDPVPVAAVVDELSYPVGQPGLRQLPMPLVVVGRTQPLATAGSSAGAYSRSGPSTWCIAGMSSM